MAFDGAPWSGQVDELTQAGPPITQEVDRKSKHRSWAGAEIHVSSRTKGSDGAKQFRCVRRESILRQPGRIGKRTKVGGKPLAAAEGFSGGGDEEKLRPMSRRSTEVRFDAEERIHGGVSSAPSDTINRAEGAGLVMTQANSYSLAVLGTRLCLPVVQPSLDDSGSVYSLGAEPGVEMSTQKQDILKR